MGSRRTPTDLEQRTHEVLDAAHAAGVRYCDDAPLLRESRGGLGIMARPPPRIRSECDGGGSKWDYRYVGESNPDAEMHEIKNHPLDVLRRQWAENRRLLGPPFDLYQIHSEPSKAECWAIVGPPLASQPAGTAQRETIAIQAAGRTHWIGDPPPTSRLYEDTESMIS